jgi:5,6-dimethylbenzimidazole synthase
VLKTSADRSGTAAAGNSTPDFGPGLRAGLASLLAWRRDVRRFRRNPLPQGTIERLVALACLAPSVGLSQPWRFVLVESAARRAAIRDDFERSNSAALAAQAPERARRYARLKLAGLDDAPCQLAVFADHGTRQGHGLGRRTMPATIDYSAVMAAHTLWLAARAEGIGMGWVSILNPAAVARELAVPCDWRLIGYFCLGYAEAEDPVPALERSDWERRRPAAEFLFRR